MQNLEPKTHVNPDTHWQKVHLKSQSFFGNSFDSFLPFCLIMLFVSSSFAQTPQAINYQGVARDNSGVVMATKTISLRLSILDSSFSGKAIYVETHSNVQTNSFGLFTLSIGKGSAISGKFESIDWSLNSKFLKVEMDPAGSNNYVLMGTSQMLAVPYSLYAEKAGNGLKAGSGIKISGDTIINTAQGTQGPKGTDGVSITSSYILNDSLFIKLSNGQILNTGYVKGDAGKQGVKGDTGIKGKEGRGIYKANIVKDSLILVLTDSSSLNAGKVAGFNDNNIYLYPEDFGAKPNISTFDNSMAFQKAIDSAVSCGKILFVKKGEYYFQKTLYVRKQKKVGYDEGLKLAGAGVNQTVLISLVKNKPLIVIENALKDSATPIPGYFFNGGYIKNIGFLGSSGSGNCLNITGWWYGLLESIQIRNFGGNAIHMPMRNNFGPPNDANGNAYTDNYSSFITIKNTQIDNNLGWGYFDEKENTSSDLLCEKTVFASNRLGGIRFGGQSIRLLGGAIAYNGFGSKTGGGLELGVNGNSSHNNFITQIEFDGNNAFHVKLNSAINTTITSCRFLYHDLIDTSHMSPSIGAILLAADSTYPFANNISITNNYVRVDFPLTAKSVRQKLYFVKFLAQGATFNTLIENNFYQSLPVGFEKYHDFERYGFYFTSRLGLTNNIKIADHDILNYFPSSSSGKMPPYFDAKVQNTNFDSVASALKLQFPLTSGGNHSLNLTEYVKYFDTATNTLTIPESGYYEFKIRLGVDSSSKAGKVEVQFIADQVKIATHTLDVATTGKTRLNDEHTFYCYAGEKILLKIQGVGCFGNLSGSDSSVFIRLLH